MLYNTLGRLKDYFSYKKTMNKKQTKYLAEDVVQKLLSYIKNQADSARKKGSSRPIIDELIIHLSLGGIIVLYNFCNCFLS